MLRFSDKVGWLAIALGVLAGCDRKGGDPHFVGHLAPLSGPERDQGLAMVQAVRLAVEEANADQSRWVGGRKVAVIHADTQGKPDLVAAQAVRLVAVNRVQALLGGLTRPDTDRLAPVAHQYTVALLGSAGSIGTPAVEEAFSLGVAANRKARIIDQFISETFQPPRIALVVNGADPGLNALADQLKRLFQDRKLPFETRSYFKSDELRGLGTGLDSTTPVVVFAGSGADAEAFRSYVRTPIKFIFAGDEIDSEAFLQSKTDDGPYWVGAYVAEAIVGDFAKKYLDKFGAAPTVGAMMSYDAAKVMFAAASDARSFAYAKIRIRLRQARPFDSLMGPITFAASDQVARGPAFVLQAKNGKAAMQKRFEPEVAEAPKP